MVPDQAYGATLASPCSLGALPRGAFSGFQGSSTGAVMRSGPLALAARRLWITPWRLKSPSGGPQVDIGEWLMSTPATLIGFLQTPQILHVAFIKKAKLCYGEEKHTQC